jgi:CRISPR/Cas system CSM-associated protein Csm3 (group 7 of RAMP superfamily)
MNQQLAVSTATRRPRTTHRNLTQRIVVTGKLVLTRPAHFGNGDADATTDLPLLLDEVTKRALIPGASLAGALRNYLREWQWGYELTLPARNEQADFDHGAWNESEILAGRLFGGHRGYKDGAQSPLIVNDAYGSPPAQTELRDGVAIDAATRTAADEKKFDYQLLPAGTKFELRFELLLDKRADLNQERLRALALALRGLSKSEIRLGARKRRGFGCCEVRMWEVTRYALNQPADLVAWLAADYPEWVKAKPTPSSGHDIAGLLGVSLNELQQVEDNRENFEIEASLAVHGSLLVRSGFDEQDRGPDTVHLHTRNHKLSHFPPDKQLQAVLPGTSVAGSIRQRAQRIANTLALKKASEDEQSIPDLQRRKKLEEDLRKGVQAFINRMFGPHKIEDGKQVRASRVIFDEEFIDGGQSLVQTRIKIDRFTQGTIEAALLEEAPHFGGTVNLKLKLHLIPNDQSEAEIGFDQGKAEIGLLLLVLKDLWLGDLPLGGASSVGRGRLQGQSATLCWKPENRELKLSAAGVLEPPDKEKTATLESYVEALGKVKWAALAPKKEGEE